MEMEHLGVAERWKCGGMRGVFSDVSRFHRRLAKIQPLAYHLFDACCSMYTKMNAAARVIIEASGTLLSARVDLGENREAPRGMFFADPVILIPSACWPPTLPHLIPHNRSVTTSNYYRRFSNSCRMARQQQSRKVRLFMCFCFASSCGHGKLRYPNNIYCALNLDAEAADNEHPLSREEPNAERSSDEKIPQHETRTYVWVSRPRQSTETTHAACSCASHQRCRVPHEEG